MDTPETRTTVYIAEDHPVFQDAVARAVTSRPEFELVGTGGDGRTVLAEIRRLVPDVVLLDRGLHRLDGIDVVRAIVRDGLSTRVVMLSADSSSGFVYDVVKLGVAGFLTKAATLDEICDTVAAVARGETVLAPEIQSGLVAELREREQHARPLSGPQIGERLYISSSTVKTHVKSLLEKLGVSDRAAAVAEAMRRGLIE
jgi:two-component system, NarL family, nitrate/nitrite response regulator NarL